MIRINLLPPEIGEKRRAESRRLYLIAVLMAVVAVLGLAWGFLLVQGQLKASDVASVRQEAASLQAQALSFKVFEDRTHDLAQRKAIAQQALADRIDWSQLMSEISLVLPTDLWLDQFDASQAVGGVVAPGAPQPTQNGAGSQTGSKPGAVLTLSAWSLYHKDTSSNAGFKPIGQLLVRLNDLDQLKDVWLQSAEQSTYRSQNAIKCTVISQIVIPSDSATSSAKTAMAAGNQ